MTTRRLRFAMIGGGPGAMIGPIHRLAARLDDRWQLVAGALSSVSERASLGAEECRIAPDRSYTDWRDLIATEAQRPADDRIDAVAIVTPNFLHAGPAIAALEAGFHVICDKPVTSTWQDALAIKRAVENTGKRFVLTHTYSGYPMVREMKAMIAAGAIGKVRVVQSQYAQDWLAESIERDGNKQASWRTDPAKSGAGGALGDIGTHAYHLGAFVTGLRAEALCADLASFGDARQLDDNAHIMLRYSDGVKGMMWLSQIAPGKGNQLRLGVYGSEGSIEWDQEHPNQLRFTALGRAPTIIERGGPAIIGGYVMRLPSHHPEGYIEAFAQLYTDAADLILGGGESASPSMLPTIDDGLEGLKFVSGAVRSHGEERWIPYDDWVPA